MYIVSVSIQSLLMYKFKIDGDGKQEWKEVQNIMQISKNTPTLSSCEEREGLTMEEKASTHMFMELLRALKFTKQLEMYVHNACVIYIS